MDILRNLQNEEPLIREIREAIHKTHWLHRTLKKANLQRAEDRETR